MISSTDPRIPVVFGAVRDATPDDAVLSEAAGDMHCLVSGADGAREGFAVRPMSGRSSHGASCGCCTPRGAAAEALGRLFLARARGEAPFFRRVVAATLSDAGAEAVRAALTGDPLVAGRYRLG